MGNHHIYFIGWLWGSDEKMHVIYLALCLAHVMFKACKHLLPWLVLLSKAGPSTLKCRSQMTWITWIYHLIIWWGYPLKMNQELSVYTAITSPYCKKPFLPCWCSRKPKEKWKAIRGNTDKSLPTSAHSKMWNASWTKCSVDRSEYPGSSSGLWPSWQSCSLACHQGLCTEAVQAAASSAWTSALASDSSRKRSMSIAFHI